jgi:hypothetical protein
MSNLSEVPKIYFSDEPIDWRTRLKDEVDPDDDDLEVTPWDVVGLLGFDPYERDLCRDL